MTREERLNRSLAQFKDAENQYLLKFGSHSLDRVIFSDPVHPIASEIDEDTVALRKAIRAGIPLKQVPEELWNQMFF